MAVTSPFLITTSLPKSSAFISSAAHAPNLDEMNLSYASGLPPLWVWPGTATLTSEEYFSVIFAAISYATEGYFDFARTSFLSFLGSFATSFDIAPSATQMIVNLLPCLVLLSIALYTFLISYGTSGRRITSASCVP